jgi:hypothetical protein
VKGYTVQQAPKIHVSDREVRAGRGTLPRGIPSVDLPLQCHPLRIYPFLLSGFQPREFMTYIHCRNICRSSILSSCYSSLCVVCNYYVTLYYGSIRLGTHYPHITWAHVMLRVQLGYLTLNSGADSHFCHSAYVTWSDVELWSARTRHVSRNVCYNRNLRGVLALEPTRALRQITWRKQSDRSVSLRQNSMLNIPTALVTSREFTRREESVSPA